MTTLEQMAREAGIVRYDVAPLGSTEDMVPGSYGPWVLYEDLEKFAALIRAQALEEAARVCEDHAKDTEPPHKSHEDTYKDGWLDASNECGWSIRALAKQPAQP